MKKFKPFMYKKNIFEINYKKIKEKNIKLLALDMDNTLIAYNEPDPSDDVIKLIRKLQKDFIVVITSNNFHNRVKYVSEKINCDYLANLFKPSKKIKKLIINKYHIQMNEVCIIGDQLITDIFLGNRLKSLTVLVDPLTDKDMKITFLNRFLEKIIKKRLNIIKGKYYE